MSSIGCCSCLMCLCITTESGAMLTYYNQEWHCARQFLQALHSILYLYTMPLVNYLSGFVWRSLEMQGLELIPVTRGSNNQTPLQLLDKPAQRSVSFVPNFWLLCFLLMLLWGLILLRLHCTIWTCFIMASFLIFNGTEFNYQLLIWTTGPMAWICPVVATV